MALVLGLKLRHPLLISLTSLLFVLSCHGKYAEKEAELAFSGDGNFYQYELWKSETAKLAHLDQIQKIYLTSTEEQRELTEIEASRIQNHASWVRYNAERIQAMNLPKELWLQNQRGLIDLDSARIDNRGRIIGNNGKVIQNYRSAADVENARIKNFGETIENRGKQLNNMDKVLDLNLKSMYGNAYSHYVSAYQRYAKALKEISKQKRYLRNKLMRSVRDMDSYYRKYNSCMRQADRVLDHHRKQGLQESRDGSITLYNIEKLYRSARAQTNGEECVERVLLKMSRKDTSYLNNLILEVDNVQGTKLKQICGLADERPTDAVSAAAIAGIEGYPGVRVDEKSFQPTMFNRPFTHFQLYKLLMANDMSIRLGLPPADDVPQHEFPVCSQRNPKVINYKDAARQLELVKYNQWDEFRPEDEAPFDFGKADYNFFTPDFESDAKYRNNKSYYSLLRDFQTIFAQVKGCTDTQKDNTAAASAQTAAVTGETTQSFLATFQNSTSPEQAESIRLCVRVSEEYRHRAAQNNASIGAILKTFQEVATEEIPRAPHPVFSKYAATPHVNAGNL